MKSGYLDKTRNKIELSGEIEKDFVINNGVRITFAEGATFQGVAIKEGTEFYNNSYIPQIFIQLSSGKLIIIPGAIDRPGTPYPGAPSSSGFNSDDNEGGSGSGNEFIPDNNNPSEGDVSATGCTGITYDTLA